MNYYKEFLKKVGHNLIDKGFSQQADTFYMYLFNNVGLINFQKSKSSTTSVTLFTINLCVSSTILREYNQINLLKKIDVDDCHWKQRIGFVMPRKQDFWWKLEADTDFDKLSEEINFTLDNFGIPEIKKYITDTNLELEWLSGRGSGLTELQIYINLITLLKLKESDKLIEVIENIRKDILNKSFKNSFEIYVKELLK